MSEVKIYRVEGYMLISHDRYPVWQKFVKDVRAIKPEHAIEYVYSVMGSRHKVKRKQIKITNVREITADQAKDRYIAMLDELERFVVQ